MTPALPPDVAAAATRAAARITAFDLHVRWQPTATSTMDLAAQAVEAGAAEGVVILADEQTGGRGRRGRTWSSPTGAGLYLSMILRPHPSASLALLTLAAGVGVHDGIVAATGLQTALKWPNDVMIGRRKLAGILAEGLDIGSPAPCVILGIGMNVLDAAHPSDISMRVASLETELGKPVDRMTVFEEVLVGVAERYDQLRRGDAGDILRAWRDRSPSAQHALVEFDGMAGTRRGVTQGIDHTGALLVKTDTGVERLVAGEVRWCS